MVQLITKETFKFGQTNIVPFAGSVDISSEGIIEVESQEIADSLVSADCGWSLVEETVATTTTSTTVSPTTTTTTKELDSQVDENSLNEGSGDELGKEADGGDLSGALENQEHTAEWLALDESNKTTLQEMVKDFPASEWRGLNKGDLIDYILEKTK